MTFSEIGRVNLWAAAKWLCMPSAWYHACHMVSTQWVFLAALNEWQLVFPAVHQLWVGPTGGGRDQGVRDGLELGQCSESELEGKHVECAERDAWKWASQRKHSTWWVNGCGTMLRGSSEDDSGFESEKSLLQSEHLPGIYYASLK